MDRLTATQAFVRIVELGSFTAAARDLGMQQATVSRWIAALEDELGIQLLERTTRALRPTEAGLRFYAEGKALGTSWSAAVSAARDQHAHLTGRLRVSVPVVFGELYVAPRLPQFMRDHPQLQVELLFSDQYVDLVADAVDVALRVGTPVDSAHLARTLTVARRRLVASPEYVKEHGAPRAPSDLSDRDCLLHSGLDNRVVWSFRRGADEARVPVRGRFRANHSATIANMACEGLGVALLASWLVDPFIERGELTHLLPEYAAPDAPVQALYASTRHTPRAVGALLDFLDETLDFPP